MQALIVITGKQVSLKLNDTWHNGVERSENGLNFRTLSDDLRFKFATHPAALTKRLSSDNHQVVVGRGRINGVPVVGFLNRPRTREDGTQVATIGLHEASSPEFEAAGIPDSDPLYVGA